MNDRRDPGGHLTEEDLVLIHYGETAGPAGTADHLATCARCAALRDDIRAALEAVSAADAEAPDPPADLADRIWDRVRPRPAIAPAPLRRTPARSYRTWAIAASLLVMLMAGFLAGRFMRPGSEPDLRPIPSAGLDRLLLLAAEDHLESARRVFAEIANLNGNPDAGAATTVDFTSGRDRAAALAGASRILRRSARDRGEYALERALDEVERLLLDIAHAPEALPREDLHLIQDRIEQQGILLKLRALADHLRRRGLDMSPASAATTT